MIREATARVNINIWRALVILLICLVSIFVLKHLLRNEAAGGSREENTRKADEGGRASEP